MPIAIQVRFIGPTDRKGSRVKAFVSRDMSVTLPYAYLLTAHENATVAAETLLKKLEWNGEFTGHGMLPNGDRAFTLGVYTENGRRF